MPIVLARPSCPGLWQISKRWCLGDAGACDRVALLRFRCLTDLENCKLGWKPARENCQQFRPLSGHRFWSLLVQLTQILGGCSETFASTYVSSSSTAVFGRGRWRVSGVPEKVAMIFLDFHHLKLIFPLFYWLCMITYHQLLSMICCSFLALYSYHPQVLSGSAPPAKGTFARAATLSLNPLPPTPLPSTAAPPPPKQLPKAPAPPKQLPAAKQAPQLPAPKALPAMPAKAEKVLPKAEAEMEQKVSEAAPAPEPPTVGELAPEPPKVAEAPTTPPKVSEPSPVQSAQPAEPAVSMAPRVMALLPPAPLPPAPAPAPASAPPPPPKTGSPSRKKPSMAPLPPVPEIEQAQAEQEASSESSEDRCSRDRNFSLKFFVGHDLLHFGSFFANFFRSFFPSQKSVWSWIQHLIRQQELLPETPVAKHAAQAAPAPPTAAGYPKMAEAPAAPGGGDWWCHRRRCRDIRIGHCEFIWIYRWVEQSHDIWWLGGNQELILRSCKLSLLMFKCLLSMSADESYWTGNGDVSRPVRSISWDEHPLAFTNNLDVTGSVPSVVQPPISWSYCNALLTCHRCWLSTRWTSSQAGRVG